MAYIFLKKYFYLFRKDFEIIIFCSVANAFLFPLNSIVTRKPSLEAGIRRNAIYYNTGNEI